MNVNLNNILDDIKYFANWIPKQITILPVPVSAPLEVSDSDSEDAEVVEAANEDKGEDDIALPVGYGDGWLDLLGVGLRISFLDSVVELVLIGVNVLLGFPEKLQSNCW